MAEILYLPLARKMTGQASQARSLGVLAGFRKHSISHLSRELGICYTLPEQKIHPMLHGLFQVSNSFLYMELFGGYSWNQNFVYM